MTHRTRFVGVRLVLGFAILAACASTVQVAAQNPGGTIISGPNPWVDITAPPWNAKCDGSTDDTAAIQNVLNSFNAAGYGRMFVPYTGNLCIVNGYSSSISGAITGSGTTNEWTITVSSVPGWVHNGMFVYVFGTGGTASPSFNGMWPIVSAGGSSIVIYNAYSGTTGTSSGGSVSIGLSTNAVVDIEGQCTTRQNYSNCSGFSGLSTTSSTVQPVYLLTAGPCTSAVLGITCPQGQDNSNTTAIRHLNFIEGSATTGVLKGGVYVLETNGYEISDDQFSNFTGSMSTDAGAGAGITLDGGLAPSTQPQPSTEQAYIANDKFFNVKYGVTTRGSNDGALLLLNHVVCDPSKTLSPTSIAFDFGFEWLSGHSGSTGGENTMFANQVESCTIGYMVDGQNDDNVISKAELGYSSPVATIGFDVLNSTNIWVDAQTLQYCTGIHVDSNSSSVHLTNPRLGGTSNSGHCTGSQPDGSGFTSATIAADSGVSAPYVTVSGFTPFGTTYGTTLNSTFTSDSVPKLAAGMLTLPGSSSGAVTMSAQSTAGTPTITWGTQSGTPVVAANTPLVINSGTGKLSFQNENAQNVLAGPGGYGASPGPPSFRLLAAQDIPPSYSSCAILDNAICTSAVDTATGDVGNPYFIQAGTSGAVNIEGTSTPLSCGTGVTCANLVMFINGQYQVLSSNISIAAIGASHAGVYYVYAVLVLSCVS
ncbi:MAG TPA: hypothetical protein VMT20_07795 [Terriglobia bacterium]|nr:hypothetical protein [Terriglobia bacterium]